MKLFKFEDISQLFVEIYQFYDTTSNDNQNLLMYMKLILNNDFDLLRLDGVVLGQILLGVTGLVGVGLGVVGTVGVGSF